MARRGQRLARRWLGFATTTSGLFALSAGTAAASLASAGNIKDTIMRTRGNLVGWIDAVGAPAKAALVSVGMIVVPEGTGTTVLQSPFTDPNADWFWYSQFLLAYEEMVTDVIDVPVITGYREVIDSKAMRIAPPDTEVQLVVENTSIDASVNINLHVAGRFLLGS